MAGRGYTRRDFIKQSLASTTLLLTARQSQWLWAATEAQKISSEKAVILLWLDGGPSQIDTFDPKPGRPTAGVLKALDTTIPGVQFSEYLPRLATITDDLAIIRTLTSAESDHSRASYLLHTGYTPLPNVIHPSIGSIVSLEKTSNEGIPIYVNIGSIYSGNPIGRGAGFLPQQHAPFVISSPERPNDALATLNEDNLKRLTISEQLDQRFRNFHPDKNVEKRHLFFQQARAIRGTVFEKALALNEESMETIKAYIGNNENGFSDFGYGCLTARRLVERGVKFVEVGIGGWDTHQDNFNVTKQLCGMLDPAFSALVTDLKNRGLFESTLVLCLGEFGRTPKINTAKGRDHWSSNFCAVLAGCGVQGGRCIGNTDADGMEIKDEPVNVPDLMATIFHIMGINPSKEHKRDDSRLIQYTNDGVSIASLLG